jgi:hypothetical protein
MDRRDLIGIPIVIVVASVISWFGTGANWSLDTAFVVLAPVSIVMTALIYHVDWPKWVRRIRRRPASSG